MPSGIKPANAIIFLVDSCQVLEIGGGSGELSNELLSYSKSRGINPSHYFMLDLGQYLLKTQRETTQSHSKRVCTTYTLADALKLPLAPNSIDLLVANEVIADLPVIKNLSPNDIDAFPNIPPGKYQKSEAELVIQAANIIKKYCLSIPKDGELFHLNYGAILLLFEIQSVLKNGGAAFIAEFSSEVIRTRYWNKVPGFFALPTEMEFPVEVELDGHSEFNIKFSHLETVAKQIGFGVESGPLHELVGLKDYNLIEFKDGVMQIDPIVLLQFRYLILKKVSFR